MDIMRKIQVLQDRVIGHFSQEFFVCLFKDFDYKPQKKRKRKKKKMFKFAR